MRKYAQDIAILAHYRFSNSHLSFEPRIGRRQMKSIGSFRQIQIVTKRHTQLGENLLGQNHARTVPNIDDLERRVHTHVITG